MTSILNVNMSAIPLNNIKRRNSDTIIMSRHVIERLRKQYSNNRRAISNINNINNIKIKEQWFAPVIKESELLKKI